MTEAAFQAARKVMQRANYLRGLITSAEGNVAKWTKIESSHRENLREAQANGAKKCIEMALKKLEAQRVKFASLAFPDHNMKAEEHRCGECGRKLSIEELCQCIYQ